jgi:probable phosphoglycerate mutase
MTGRPVDAEFAVPVAAGLPQGSLALIEAGRETLVHRGSRDAPV